MFITYDTLKRVDITKPYVDATGTQYPTFPAHLMGLLQEITLPDPPLDYTPELYNVKESDDAPYVIYTRKSEAEIAQIVLQQEKELRAKAVASIVVRTVSGNVFDGNEDAQNRMSRAITGMEDTDETLWVLADNTPVMVGKAELKEALRLAGQAQTELWVKPYQPA